MSCGRVVYRVEKSKVLMEDMEDTWEKDLDFRLSKRSLEFFKMRQQVSNISAKMEMRWQVSNISDKLVMRRQVSSISVKFDMRRKVSSISDL